MHLKLPRELNINGSIWLVRFLTNIQGDEFTAGLTCPKTKTIFVKASLSPEDRWVTFWHEFLHALDFEYDIRIPHEMVYAMEEPLAEAMRMNSIISWAGWASGE